MSRTSLIFSGIGGTILLITLLAIFPALFGQAQNSPAERAEFSFQGQDAFTRESELYNRTINCYFNRGVQFWLQAYSKEYQKEVSRELPLSSIEDTQLGCDNLGVFGQYYKQKLEKLLSAIAKNRQKLDETAFSNQPKGEVQNPCNLPFEPLDSSSVNRNTNGLRVLRLPVAAPTEERGDYFVTLESRVVSPVYAVALVSECYRQVYTQSLDRYVNLAYDSQSILEDKGETSLSREALIEERTARLNRIEIERRRVRTALDLALANFLEFTESYPLHVQYEKIILHAQKLRDNVRPLRVIFDQLQYKLPNQSTPP